MGRSRYQRARSCDKAADAVSCQRKRYTFPSNKIAQTFAVLLRTKSLDLKPYKCLACGKFHLTRQKA